MRTYCATPGRKRHEEVIVKMRMYETMMILHPDVTDDRVLSVLNKVEGIIEQAGGKVAEVDQWGVRKLAYRISKQSRGYYTLVKFATAPTIIAELERTLSLAEDCIRFMTVNLEQELTAEGLAAIQKVHKKSSAPSDDHEGGEGGGHAEEAAAEAPQAAERAEESPAGAAEPAAEKKETEE